MSPLINLVGIQIRTLIWIRIRNLTNGYWIIDWYRHWRNTRTMYCATWPRSALIQIYLLPKISGVLLWHDKAFNVLLVHIEEIAPTLDLETSIPLQYLHKWSYASHSVLLLCVGGNEIVVTSLVMLPSNWWVEWTLKRFLITHCIRVSLVRNQWHPIQLTESWYLSQIVNLSLKLMVFLFLFRLRIDCESTQGIISSSKPSWRSCWWRQNLRQTITRHLRECYARSFKTDDLASSFFLIGQDKLLPDSDWLDWLWTWDVAVLPASAFVLRWSN